MRNTFMILLLAATLSACGGSGPSLSPTAGSGSFLSSTAQLDQRFLYALSSGQGQLVAYRLAEEEDGHDHAHAHGQVHSQHDHDHDHGHPAAHEHGEVEFVELDASPYTLPGGSAHSLVVVADGKALLVLFTDGVLRNYPIDGVTGLLGEPVSVASGVTNPRKLRVSAEGDVVAVLGDSLALFAVAPNGELTSPPASLPDSTDWNDLALGHEGGVAATDQGAVGFIWQPGGPIFVSTPVSLPGDRRGGLTLVHDEVFVTNPQDDSLSELSLDEQSGLLSLIGTTPLPTGVESPGAIAALLEGEDLMLAVNGGVIRLHRHEGDLEEEGELPLGETVSEFFPLAGTDFVLTAHALGKGFHQLRAADGLELISQLKPELSGFTSFGQAHRVETVTVTEKL